jgi:hypothetical protein
VSNPSFVEEVVGMIPEAEACLENIRHGDRTSLTEMKQFWAYLKTTGASNGKPAVTVLGSALESLSKAWQRARAAGREHPDAPRLIQEALQLLPELLQAGGPKGGSLIKDLCARSTELTEALSSSDVPAPKT